MYNYKKIKQGNKIKWIHLIIRRIFKTLQLYKKVVKQEYFQIKDFQ